MSGPMVVERAILQAAIERGIEAARQKSVGINDEEADRLRMVGETTQRVAVGTYHVFVDEGDKRRVCSCPAAQACPGLWADLPWVEVFVTCFDDAMYAQMIKSGPVEVR
jgi:hypothetical protein